MSRALSFAVFFVLANLSLCGYLPAPAQAAPATVSASVLFDFGNGTAVWGDAALSSNLTAINATELACASEGIAISVMWHPQYGASVNTIGGLGWSASGEWWHLWQWNATLREWEFAELGAGAITMTDGAALAWSYVGDSFSNGVYTPLTKPAATPIDRYPCASFRGDLDNTGAQIGNLSTTNALRWSFDTASYEVDSSPAIYRGKMFINTWTGFYALYANNGTFAWNNTLVNGMSSPAIYGGRIFVGGASDPKVYALEPSTGQIIWSTALQASAGHTGVSSSPKINNGFLYIGSSNENGGSGKVHCLYANNGTIVWNYTSSPVYFSTPAVHGGKVYIGTMGFFNSTNNTALSWSAPFELLCLYANNGTLAWSYAVNGSIASSPAVSGGSVYFSSKDGKLYSLDAASGTLRWTAQIGASTSSPAIHAGRIFIGSGSFLSSGKVYAFDESGNKLWEYVPNGGVQGAITVAGGQVLFATNTQNGTLYSLDVSGNLLWRYTPAPEDYLLSSPVVSNDTIYIASDNGIVYCLSAPVSGGEAPQEAAKKQIIPGFEAQFVLVLFAACSIAYAAGRIKTWAKRD